jgi:hypothetical protein
MVEAFPSVSVPVSVNTPFCSVSAVLTVELLVSVTPVALLILRLGKGVANVPLIVCGAAPLKNTVPVVAVKAVALELFVKLPLTVRF